MALLLAGAAVSLVYGAATAARADELQVADPFAAAQTIEQDDLDGLRGGDVEVLNIYKKTTNTTATNNSNNSIGETTINTGGGDGGVTGGNGGAVYGGSVNFNDNALQNFGGVYTSAINTAPAGIATALTSMSITLNP
jgi:hypothetical protein